MGTAERRKEIIELLYRQRYESIGALAEKFAVSTRTIQRDVEILSLNNPIYTKTGRHGGGVYVVDECYIHRVYLSDEEVAVLNKVLSISQNKKLLSWCEIEVLKSIIALYSKPNEEYRKGKI